MNLKGLALAVAGHGLAVCGLVWAIPLAPTGFSFPLLAAGVVVGVGVSMAAWGMHFFAPRVYPYWLGTVLTGGFGVWTLYLCRDGFSCWAIPTGFMVIIGLVSFRTRPPQRPIRTGISPPRPTFPPAVPFDPELPFPSASGYDTFISYKSDDVGIVRLVVEQLLAAGYTPWFAEYLILLRRRDEFQTVIDLGIAHSRSGVAFTNDRYADSQYTRLELRQLLDSPACGLERLIEVRMPPEPDTCRHFPELGMTHPVCDAARDPNAVLRFLKSQPRFERLADALPAQDLKSQGYYDPNLGYSLDLGEWWIEDLGGVKVPFVGHVGPMIVAKLGGRKARGKLLIGPVPALRRDLTAPQQDQRAYYNRIIEFADFYTQAVRRQCAGVHMLFDGPLTQFAVSYWADTAWVRKYAIDRPDPRTGTAMEFSFTFAFFGPFREFCRHVCLFDALVASLTWPAKDPRKRSAPSR